jgi:hypothetical protein
MLDQSHNIENSLEGIIYSVMNIQTAYAKSLLVDRKALAGARAALIPKTRNWTSVISKTNGALPALPTMNTRIRWGIP